FIEAFANIYRSVAHAIAAHEAGTEPEPWTLDFPTVQDGATGVHFIHTALESSAKQAWVDASYTPPSM
ncbi:MAG: gfo/Idh/MocA family oxidoreductase, partial [Salinibacter sp.]